MPFTNLPFVRNPKNKNNKYPEAKQNRNREVFRTVSPSPQVFGRKEPEALKRQISTTNQKDSFEDIIRYGEDNALPLKIAQAVSESPAASSCIETVAHFIKGSGFTNKDMMDFQIDKDGTTLWDFHCQLADCIALFWGFAVNFKFNKKGKITNSYYMNFESCRFKAPGDKSPYITAIKFNPYFGTSEYQMEFTREYPVFNVNEVKKQITTLPESDLEKWGGQVYYWGKTGPINRFYPVPKYWSAKEAIQADHKLEEFHDQELENGFFQSVLINAIGDPSAWSKNPRLQKEIEQTDGSKKKVPTKTVGEEFSDQMSTAFSGSRKAGTAMVFWSNNHDESAKIQEFPTNLSGDRIIATHDSIIKIITIATRVPSILANISEGVSLGSGGSEIQKAIELMQSRTVEFRRILENFYNKILIPNLERVPPNDEKIEIVNYNPISVKVEPNKEIWAFLNEQEKVEFIKKFYPDIQMFRNPVAVTSVVQPTPGQSAGEENQIQQTPTTPDANQDAIDSLIRGLSRRDLSKFYGYVNDYKKGRATLEQTKVFLRAFKLTDDQILLFLNDPEGDGV